MPASRRHVRRRTATGRSSRRSEPRSRSPGGSSASGQSEQAPLNTKAVLRSRFTYQWPAVLVVTSHCTLLGPWGNTGMFCPPRLACAFTVNRTVAARFPAGCADTIWSEAPVILGPLLRNDRTHERGAGGTVRATAATLLRPRADQNAVTARSVAAAWAAESVPDTCGGPEEPLAEPPDFANPLPMNWDMLAVCAAGGGETRTGTPKS